MMVVSDLFLEHSTKGAFMDKDEDMMLICTSHTPRRNEEEESDHDDGWLRVRPSKESGV